MHEQVFSFIVAIIKTIFVTRFDKTRLPHTSNSTTMKVYNSMIEYAISLTRYFTMLGEACIEIPRQWNAEW